ncbi:MAG TPA: hypothetical protein VEB40_12645 [Flavipsychrobacter sp.]|nr:hypothetical protein [Flavipsychrobacter sp.]
MIDHLDGKMWTEYKVCHGDTCKEYGDKLYYYVGGWRAVVDNGDTVLEANWETVTYRTDSPDGIPSLVRVTCAPIFVIKKCIKTNPLTFTIVQVTNIQIENELSLQDSSQFIVSGESWFNDDNNNYAFFRLSKPTKETTSLLNGSNK